MGNRSAHLGMRCSCVKMTISMCQIVKTSEFAFLSQYCDSLS